MEMMASEYRIRLGKAIREVRLKRNLSQQLLASMVGTSKAHVWRIENGKVGTTIDCLLRVSEALEVRVSELTRGLQD